MLRRLWPRALAMVVPVALGVLGVSACATTARVVDIRMALDEEGWRVRTEFFTDTQKIYCVGKMGVGRPSAIVEMKIRQYQRYDFIANRFIDVDGIAAYDEESPERSKDPIDITLEVTPRGPTDGESGDSVPFLPGRYECEVFLDGELQGTAPFNINFPPCPEFTIAPETRCYGFYREGDTCPRFGQSSTSPRVCKCTAAEGWACPGE